MARAAVLGRLTWRVATVVGVRDETADARTIVFELPGWPGHAAGQHVDVRLTAPDGYSTQRSYSIASAPGDDHVELTVERLPDGEVSPYLTQVLSVGDQIEIRGPIGGWFVWDVASPDPVLLIAGGSGVVPLAAMVRTRFAIGSSAPFRLLYSVRDPASVLFGAELGHYQNTDPSFGVHFVFTRIAPADALRPVGRIDARFLTDAVAGSVFEPVAGSVFEPARAPSVFVCGPTGFVEAVADLLVAAGHEAGRIKTERFGPSGSQR